MAEAMVDEEEEADEEEEWNICHGDRFISSYFHLLDFYCFLRSAFPSSPPAAISIQPKRRRKRVWVVERQIVLCLCVRTFVYRKVSAGVSTCCWAHAYQLQFGG